MGRGPGIRQRALINALATSEVVRVVPEGVTASDAQALCRAAKRLAQTGRARAIYRRKRGSRGWAPRLMLTRPDSSVQGDSFPVDAPAWVTPPMEGPEFIMSLGVRLQALVITEVFGRKASMATVARAARKYLAEREREAEDEACR